MEFLARLKIYYFRISAGEPLRNLSRHGRDEDEEEEDSNIVVTEEEPDWGGDESTDNYEKDPAFFFTRGVFIFIQGFF